MATLCTEFGIPDDRLQDLLNEPVEPTCCVEYVSECLVDTLNDRQRSVWSDFVASVIVVGER